jgi:hypothetical protein
MIDYILMLKNKKVTIMLMNSIEQRMKKDMKNINFLKQKLKLGNAI